MDHGSIHQSFTSLPFSSQRLVINGYSLAFTRCRLIVKKQLSHHYPASWMSLYSSSCEESIDCVSETLRKRSTISETQLTTSPSIPRNFFLFFKDDTGNRWINASTPSAKTKRRDETSLQRISFIWKQGLCDTE